MSAQSFRFAGALFDLDGTLADTAGDLLATLTRSGRELFDAAPATPEAPAAKPASEHRFDGVQAR